MDALAAAAAAAAALPERPRGPRRLTTVQRWAIVWLHTKHTSVREIARQVECNRATVRAVIMRWAYSGTPGSGSRSGRPRCTDGATDVNIAVEARVTKFTSPRRIRCKLGLEASRATIDRRLREAGLFGRVARHKRAYTERERLLRLEFAEQYKGWSVAQWEKVLFSDEKCFYGDGFCGRVWVRREEGTALDPEHCVDKRTHPVKVNVWACFTAAGVGYSHIFNENMDAALMKTILSANLLPSAALHFAVDPPEQFWLLHDNDKKFKSRLVGEWLHNNGVSTIDFPPYSPDLNPIENLWAIIARRVEEHDCDSMEKLQDAIADEWDAVDKKKELLRSLVHSMPARIQAVIDAEGWHTKY